MTVKFCFKNISFVFYCGTLSEYLMTKLINSTILLQIRHELQIKTARNERKIRNPCEYLLFHLPLYSQPSSVKFDGFFLVHVKFRIILHGILEVGHVISSFEIVVVFVSQWQTFNIDIISRN